MAARRSFSTDSVDDEQRVPLTAASSESEDQDPLVWNDRKSGHGERKILPKISSLVGDLSTRRLLHGDWKTRRYLALLCLFVLCIFFAIFAARGVIDVAARARGAIGTTATERAKIIREKLINATAAPGQSHPYCTTWPLNYATSARDDPLPISSAPIKNLPNETSIVAVIFFGRARNLDILDCYLRRNLAANGGVLDEVHFIRHTKREEDLAYINELVTTEPDYKVYDSPEGCSGGNFGCIWPLLTDPNTLYVKLDDDIAWIHDDAFRHIIQTRIDNPKAWGISGNIINTPLMTFFHFHSGAVRPYLPEYDPQAQHNFEAPTWRPSRLPRYDGVKEPKYRESETPASETWDFPPPYNGHYWRPVDGNATTLLSTPIGRIYGGKTYTNHDVFLTSWAAAAQNQYSLLENIERDELERYWGATQGGLYNNQFARYNLNFFAFWGSDIADHVPIAADDEQTMTVTIPLETARPHLIDMKALVVHFHFNFQSKLLLHTDLLDRYRAYANERICTSRNQKVPLTYQCRES